MDHTPGNRMIDRIEEEIKERKERSHLDSLILQFEEIQNSLHLVEKSLHNLAEYNLRDSVSEVKHRLMQTMMDLLKS